MTVSATKVHQVGGYAAGSRLLEPRERTVPADQMRPDSLTSGHVACQGCGEELGARYVLDAAMRAAGGQIVVADAAGCPEVVSAPCPETARQIPWMHSLFGNAPAVAAGIAAALKVKGRDDVRVVSQGGDGGIVDVGLSCLSGMFERNHDVLYVGYDNQAYMNTGVRRSGDEPGNPFSRGKNVPLIAIAHQIPYVATATVSEPHDLEDKVRRAVKIRGARYLHVFTPCPLGWGGRPRDAIAVARLAKECGLFPVFEAEHGEVTGVTKLRRRVPVDAYLRLQKRYAHLFGDSPRPDLVARIQGIADANIARFGLLDGAEDERPSLGRRDRDRT
ncbi:MAG: thiamine pyrophosphate-dependent enzyme [Stackebrandtia sp.]